MADGSKIEWTDATWNIITGCSVLTPGCTNCYAMKLAGTRLRTHPSRRGLTTMTKAGSVWNGKVRFNDFWLNQPLRWSRPRMVFVCAHSDLFHESIPDDWIDKVFAVMALCHRHTFQVLTKRANRMMHAVARIGSSIDFLEKQARLMGHTLKYTVQPEIANGTTLRAGETVGLVSWPLPNVWLGVSAERQQEADGRVPLLLRTPAAVRFVSLEPLIGPITLWHNSEGVLRGCGVVRDGAMTASTPHDPPEDVDTSYPGLDWVIVGGESGKDARPMNPEWPRSIRDQCVMAGVPYFFKQWGEWVFDERVGRKEMRGDDQPHPIDERWSIIRVGKKAAGRALDGRTWDEMPGGKGKPPAGLPGAAF